MPFSRRRLLTATAAVAVGSTPEAALAAATAAAPAISAAGMAYRVAADPVYASVVTKLARRGDPGVASAIAWHFAAMHPQTLMAFKLSDDILPTRHGYPFKLRIPTEPGFKNPKFVTTIYVTNQRPKGFWTDRGCNWFSRI